MREEAARRGNGRRTHLAVGALLTGALVWGVLWYPYRVLAGLGISGIAASALTYAVALALALVFWRRALAALRPSWLLAAIGLAGAACNMGYVLATLHGEVMRVLLLFYLAPLWTILLARWWLGEQLGVWGLAVVGLSLGGAATMLWHPAMGLPWPRNGAEWLGLASGFFFACSNVLSRRAQALSIEVKSVAMFVGALVISGALLLTGWGSMQWPRSGAGVLWLLGIGVILMLVNRVVQFGLHHTAANRAIVILLSELVFAAISAWFLAGESMGAREWLGGAMIAAASLLSTRLEARVEAAA